MRSFQVCLLVGSLFSAVCPSVQGQWITQSVNLTPGWNAVHLRVHPEPRACAEVFAGLPVESVWMWNGTFSPQQFISDANTLKPEDPAWLSYVPAGQSGAAQSSLFRMLGARSYLIRLAGNSALEWKVKGVPVLRPPDWVPDSFHLAGFAMGTGTPPQFTEFFAGSPSHRGNPIYRLLSDGNWQEVAAPGSTAMKDGQAFFLSSKGPSTFPGVLGVTLEQVDRVDFGRVVVEQTVRIKNLGAAARSFRVSMRPSEAPPVGRAALAGAVPLSWWREDFQAGTSNWEPMPGELNLGVLQPGEERRLRLAVRREAFSPFVLPAGATEAAYQGILEITDAARSVIQLVPVTAQADVSPRAAQVGLRSIGSVAAPPHPRTGLWAGHAVIRAVSQPSHLTDRMAPRPASGDASIRLLIHVDKSGQARLLQSVTEMFRPGSRDQEGNQVSSGRAVLVTDARQGAQFSGAALRDGRSAGRRYSSVAFGFAEPQRMQGDFGNLDQALTCTITHDHRHALNPFKHRYHPEHDGLGRDFVEVLPEGRETFTIVRELSLRFAAQDPFNLDLPEYGSKQLGGTYQETILGIHKDPIRIEGSFRLSRASEVPTLNDEP